MDAADFGAERGYICGNSWMPIDLSLSPSAQEEWRTVLEGQEEVLDAYLCLIGAFPESEERAFADATLSLEDTLGGCGEESYSSLNAYRSLRRRLPKGFGDAPLSYVGLVALLDSWQNSAPQPADDEADLPDDIRPYVQPLFFTSADEGIDFISSGTAAYWILKPFQYLAARGDVERERLFLAEERSSFNFFIDGSEEHLRVAATDFRNWHSASSLSSHPYFQLSVHAAYDEVLLAANRLEGFVDEGIVVVGDGYEVSCLLPRMRGTVSLDSLTKGLRLVAESAVGALPQVTTPNPYLLLPCAQQPAQKARNRM